MIRRTTAPLAVLVAVLALLVAACGSSGGSSSSTTTAPGSDVEITDAWVRATPGGATAGAAYLTISSTDGDRLVSAAVPTDVAAVTELHETVESSDTSMDDSSDMGGGMEGSGMGQMTMRPVTGIDVPAGGSVSLEPGGMHVMLIDLVAPLTDGDSVALTLTFEKAGAITVDAPVRAS